jgi:hypothetical protein
VHNALESHFFNQFNKKKIERQQSRDHSRLEESAIEEQVDDADFNDSGAEESVV